jgi:hypothetical protein
MSQYLRNEMISTFKRKKTILQWKNQQQKWSKRKRSVYLSKSLEQNQKHKNVLWFCLSFIVPSQKLIWVCEEKKSKKLYLDRENEKVRVKYYKRIIINKNLDFFLRFFICT